MVTAQAACYTNFSASLVWYENQAEFLEVEAAFNSNSAGTGWAGNNYWIGYAIRPGGCQGSLLFGLALGELARCADVLTSLLWRDS
jgi:hypothetical protein